MEKTTSANFVLVEVYDWVFEYKIKSSWVSHLQFFEGVYPHLDQAKDNPGRKVSSSLLKMESILVQRAGSSDLSFLSLF